MAFASPLARETKLDRALVIAFALAEVLVEGGERVGMPGLMRPTGSRNVIEQMARGDRARSDRAREPAADVRARRRSPRSCVLSDLWSPIAEVRDTLAQLSATGAQRPCRADRRSGRGDLPLFGPRRVRRAGRRRRDHRRPRRDLARRLRGARRAPSRRDPRRDRPARLELHHPPHRPAGERAAAGAARAASARATTRRRSNRRPHGMALGRRA